MAPNHIAHLSIKIILDECKAFLLSESDPTASIHVYYMCVQHICTSEAVVKFRCRIFRITGGR